MSFEEAYKQFKEYAKKRHKKQSFENFVYNFDANILSYFNGKLLSEISVNDIESWKDFILEKNFCNNHNKNLFSMIKKFFQYCSIHFDFDYSIFSEILPFQMKIEFKKSDYYTLKEFKKFIKGFNVEDIVYKRFFEFMFYVGSRPGEAMALRFSDLVGNSIIINKTIDEHGNRDIGTPKTLSSNRIVCIDSHLRRDLLKLKEYYDDKYGRDYDYFIFGGMKPLAPTTINRRKLKVCNKVGIRPITLHQFRHSHATLLLHSGILIHEISKRLGHSKVSTTLDVYTHSSYEHEKRVLSTLNSVRFNFFENFVYNFKK